MEKMTRVELNTLIDKLIMIKDRHDLTRSERDDINDACNLIEHNMDVLAEDSN